MYGMLGMLSRNTSLKSLDLSFNNLSQGTHAKQMNLWFGTNKTMEHVNLNECMLGETHMIYIAKSFQAGNKFKKLILSGNLML